MKKSGLILCVILWICNPVKSQDFNTDIIKIRKNYYSKTGQISYRLRIYYYDRKNIKIPIDSSFGEYCFSDNRCTMQIEGLKRISDGQYDVMINDNNRSIVVSKKQQSLQLPDFTSAYFDSLSSSTNTKLIRKQTRHDITTAVFSFKGQLMDSLILGYDINSYLLKFVNVYYNRPFSDDYNIIPVINIFYENQKVLPRTNPELFSFKKYLQIVGQQVFLSKKYNNYSLVNNLKF